MPQAGASTPQILAVGGLTAVGPAEPDPRDAATEHLAESGLSIWKAIR